MTVSRRDWVWFGSPGHLIVGRDCRFHLATLIGEWWVSTVGEWLPDSSSWHIHADSLGVTIEGMGDARRADFMNKIGYIEIGSGRKYETMVFRAGPSCEQEECGGCGIPFPSVWDELDSDGYNTAGDATRGHYTMCEKVAALPKGEAPSWDKL